MNLKELRNARREHVEPHVRTLLAHEGCPACIETAHGETSYFVWLLIETYGFPEWLAEFAAGWGFCQTHGERLLRHEKAGDQISYIHSHATSRILHQLAGAASGKPLVLGLCPACHSTDETSSRTLLFLRKLLLSADDHARYGHPGLLCFSHLRALLPWMPWRSLAILLRQHETALRDAAESFKKAMFAKHLAHLALARIDSASHALSRTSGKRRDVANSPDPKKNPNEFRQVDVLLTKGNVYILFQNGDGARRKPPSDG